MTAVVLPIDGATDIRGEPARLIVPGEESKSTGRVWYHPDAVLLEKEVALWLRVSHDTIEKLPIKRAPIGTGDRNRRRRIRAQWVIDYLEEIAV